MGANDINRYLYRAYTSELDRYQYIMADQSDRRYNNMLDIEEPPSFKAIVLSGFRTEINTGIGTDQYDARLIPTGDGKNHLEITVWPLGAWYGRQIPDPALITNKPKLLSIIGLCSDPTFRIRSKFPIDGNQSPLSFGQIIDIHMEHDSYLPMIKTYTFWYPPGMPEREPNFDALWGISSLPFAKDLFAGTQRSSLMEEYTPPPIVAQSPKQITLLAKGYDNDTSNPYKSNNDSLIGTLHPEFVPYIKAFILKAKVDKRLSVRINPPRGAFRSPAQQQQLLDQWYATGATTKKPAPVGASYHQAGLAIDFNPWFENGGNLHSTNNSKQEWVDSGIADIASSIGLRWGGNFAREGTAGYDPVHVDFGDIVSRTTYKKMISIAVARKVKPTQISLDEARLALQDTRPFAGPDG